MRRVAPVYIEYLAMPSLLLSKMLADYNLMSPALLSIIQKYHEYREHIISVPWLYGTEGLYVNDVPHCVTRS
jgi:hypothetical protein